MGFKLAGFCLLACALILSVSSTEAFADTSSVQAISRSLQAAELGTFHPMGAPRVTPVVRVEEPAPGVISQQPAAQSGLSFSERREVSQPVVLEPARTLSLQRLRYEVYRFPDHDSVNRFAEVATELPPLFE